MPKPFFPRTALCLSIAGALAASGCGSSDDDNDNGGQAPGAPNASAAVAPKALTFSWSSVSGAEYYRVSHDPDGNSGFSDISGELQATEFQAPLAAHLNNWSDARYLVEACNSHGCSAGSDIYLDDQVSDAIGYLKAGSAQQKATFGFAMAISADGATLAVGAPRFDIAEDAGTNSGAVFIFTASDADWELSHTLQNPAPDMGSDDLFGYSLALSEDGTTLAIGAPYEDSAKNSEAGDNSTADSGAVYVYQAGDSGWQQQARLKASNAEEQDFFGVRVALSADGSRLAASAPYEDSEASGIDGDQDDNSVELAGAVYLFEQADSSWSQQAYIKPSVPSWHDSPCFDPRPPGIECYSTTPSRFGYSLAFADDGNMLAVGSPGDNSSSGGINGDAEDFKARSSGAVHILRYTDAGWAHSDYIKAAVPGINDEFGLSLSLSSDGTRLAVGAPYEDGSEAGPEADAEVIGEADSGAAYVFTYDGSWQQQQYLKAEENDEDNLFSWQVMLSGDGNTLVAGTPRDDSDALAIGSDWDNNRAPSAGAAYVYQLTGDHWALGNYLKASNTDANDTFGRTLALSRDGQTLAITASGEDGSGTGVTGDSSDNSTIDSGAVFLY
ncbi:hypothetical protein [Gilvimarinus agarilyticus]|uniref:hypothetical protein n=1 Tax=Gilvimarinus agarilyticus TaxID=679259 RepID=UPI0005A2A8F3|nr:hypothetical protein [Gilvimarinus agarilyticus]